MLAKKKTPNAGSVLPTAPQICELIALVVTQMANIVKLMDRPTVQYWIGRPKELGAVLKKTMLKDLVVDEERIADWCRFYAEVFDLELDPASIKSPPKREGFGWLVLVAKDLTRNGVFEKCYTRFGEKAWRYYDDLDKAVTVNDREATETYAVRVRDCVEADEIHRNKSANTVTKEGVKGMTNLERMLLELWYNWKTQDHLDKETLTICSGSRFADGYVPFAYWDDGRFKVGYVHSDYRYGYSRVREVVSLPAVASAKAG